MSLATWSREFFEKFPKKSSHFENLKKKIAKDFGGFGYILSFFLLKLSYLANRF